jgi:hypothetical protein
VPLLGQRGEQIENDTSGTEFDNDAGSALRDQAGDEMHVAAEPVELGDRDRALAGPRLDERRLSASTS